MRVDGTVRNGVVVLDESVKIPDGTRVIIELSKDEASRHLLPDLPFPVVTNEEGCISPLWVASLPPDQRDAVHRASADAAVHDYSTDPELTEFTRALEGEDFYNYDEER